MNQALHYIEEHLTDEIDVAKAASVAYCSEYHFRRMFSSLAGIPLSEYIRRRRLTRAAFDLLQSEQKITDIALQYQYQSPDSFSNAFYRLHGIRPSEIHNQQQALKAYPMLTFQLTMKGGNPMNYRIVEKEAFTIIGLKKRVKLIYEGVNPEIASMWESLSAEKIAEWKSLSNVEPVGMVSASTNFSERTQEQSELDHYIGVLTTNPVSAQTDSLELSAGTWAVFTAEGPFPETLQTTWAQIYSEWFPTSNYEQTNGPEILWNADKDTTSPTFKSEIWIPVIKRSS